MADQPKYHLHIKVRSNEHPFAMDYRPVPWAPTLDDALAIEWGTSMREGLGSAYDVTLFKDGEVLALPEEAGNAG